LGQEKTTQEEKKSDSTEEKIERATDNIKNIKNEKMKEEETIEEETTSKKKESQR
jgi:hypothetical protein